MKLQGRNQKICNILYIFLKNQPPEFFTINTKVKKCPDCKGTGIPLSFYKESLCSYSWDNETFCDTCKGLGYSGIEGSRIGETHFICKKCGGLGCGACDFNGIVDWIKYVRS
jgi:hypothetical protein